MRFYLVFFYQGVPQPMREKPPFTSAIEKIEEWEHDKDFKLIHVYTPNNRLTQW